MEIRRLEAECLWQENEFKRQLLLRLLAGHQPAMIEAFGSYHLIFLPSIISCRLSFMAHASKVTVIASRLVATPVP